MRYSPLLLVAVLVPAAPLGAADSVKDQITKLVSPVTAERRAGEAWLAEKGPEVITALLAEVEKGDAKTQASAIESLTLLVSPWQRGLERKHRHHGQIELFFPERPTARPVDHPQAPVIRKALLDAIAKSLKAVPRDPKSQEECDIYSQHSNVIGSSCTALAEIADDATAKSLRGLLDKIAEPNIGLSLMHALETIYGLPNHYRMGGFCGVGLTPEALAEIHKNEMAGFAKSKTVFFAWLDRHAALPPAERYAAAIQNWVKGDSHTANYYVSRGNGMSVLTLVHLGEAAVPELRKQQARETTLHGRGFCEVAIAAITGKVDDKLVRELLSAKNLEDPNLHHIGLQIIALSGSKDYRKELVAMLGNNRYSALDVAHTLAIVHRRDALDVLRTQPKSNYIAACAVKELESWPE